MDIKGYLKDKAVGFYVTAGVAVLCLLSAILYVVIFSSIDEMIKVSWGVFVFLLLGFILTMACLILPLFVPFLKEWLLPIAPYVIGAASIIGLCLFMPSGYDYASKNMIGAVRLEFGFFLCAAFFLITALAGTAGIFIKVIKKEKKEASV